MLGTILKKIRGNVIAGGMLLLPLFTTLYVFIILFQLVDQALPKAFHYLFPRTFPERWPLPGIGLAITLFIAYFAGLAAKNIIGQFVINTGNALIAHIPILNKIYLGIQQIIDAVKLSNKKLFERPVLVKYPHENSYCIAFVTGHTTGDVRERLGRPTVSVFLPTTPNPTSGFLLYIPQDEVIELDMNVETAVKLVMSAGMVNSDQLRKTQHLFAATPQSLKGWNWLRHIRGRPPENKTGPHDTLPGAS